MKLNKKINWGLCLAYILSILLAVAFIGLEIFTFIKYGGQPHNEIPGWVLWLWFSHS